MAYQVPKFIEEETKLMGLITFNQLWILLSFAAVLIILFSVLQLWLWFILFAILAPLGLFLAFGKVNDMPVYSFFMPAIRHLWLPKYYLWQKEQSVRAAPEKPSPEPTPETETTIKKTLDSQTIQQLTEIFDK
ncbi:MAG: hypothetical protein PHF45_01135 [Candidatus Pacebacteria bacterium]|nr:hypothetical protein [Candidatus Paceibacterota bacterium]